MRTRTLDLHDDASCRRAHHIQVAAQSLGRPWHEPSSFEEKLLEFRHVDKAEPMEVWEAVSDTNDSSDSDDSGSDDSGGPIRAGLVTGIATLWLPHDDNTTQMWCEVAVDPAHRRRGAGGALVERLVDRAAAENRTTLIIDFMVPMDGGADHPYRRFAARHGFTLGSTEICRHLRLPVADDLLDGLMDMARPAYQGAYHLETHVDGVPETLRPSLCGVMNLLGVDAPTGALEFEPETVDPARYADGLALEAKQGRTRLTTVAVHEASAEVVGYSDLMLRAGASTQVWQWGTMVAQGHRGHRLGTAVKVENLRRLQHDHPKRGLVATANDETNASMVDINLALGFEVVELCLGYQRKLG